MSASDKAGARITLIDERLARLRAERERLIARTNRAERKRDTRRKIVLGGTVLAALGRDGVPALRTATDLRQWLDAQLERPQDRRAFDLGAPGGPTDSLS